MASALQESPSDPFAGFDESPAAYLRVARSLTKTAATTRVAMLATFTIDVLSPYLVVEGARRGLKLATSAAPFGQLEQQVFDRASALYTGSPDAIACALRLEDSAP